MSAMSGRAFPVMVFPEKIRRIIENTCQDLNFPTSYIAASLFLAVSVAVGNSRLLKVRDGWKVKPILYMALLGRPGAVKTHPINYALAPLKKSDNETLARYAKELEKYRKTPVTERTDKPKARQIIVKDATIEAIAKVLLSNRHGICIHFDELNGWFGSFNRYHKSGSDEEQWLSLYSGDSIVVNRKTLDDVISVPDPFVCVIGSIQPNVLIKCFKGQKTDNGFLFRILFVENSSDGAAVLWNDEDLPSNAGEEWNNFLMNILYSSKQIEDNETIAEYTFDEQAWSLIRHWQNDKEIEFSNNGEDHIIAIFRKIQDYALRFCLPIQVMREISGEAKESRKIDGISVARAISLAEYFLENAKNVYETIQYSGKEDLSRITELLDMLPHRFTRAQAVTVGENLGISRSTIFRHITGDSDDIFVRKMCHGVYEKK